MLVIAGLFPAAYNTMEGYQIQQLRQEQDQLKQERPRSICRKQIAQPGKPEPAGGEFEAGRSDAAAGAIPGRDNQA